MSRSVDVLGQPYEIIRQPLEDHGRCDTERKCIVISETTGQEGQTLLHEVLHAILAESGLSWIVGESEEGIVRAIEGGLWRAGYRRVVCQKKE